MKIIKWLLIIGLNIFLGLSLLFPSRVESPTFKDSPLDKESMYFYINEYRAQNDLPPLSTENFYCEYAKERSEEIITDWSHDQWVADGVDNIKRYNTICPECEFMGENIAYGATMNIQLLTAWKNSPLHNEALLDKRYDIMCLETTWNNGVPYTVLEFGDIE